MDSKLRLYNESVNTLVYYLSVLVITLISAGLYAWLVPVTSSNGLPEELEVNTYSCAGSGSSDKVFSIYALSYFSAKRLADSLCLDPRVSKRVGNVEAQWRHENFTKLDVILGLKYDLIVGHAAYIETPQVLGVTGYTEIGSYQPYTGYFIASADKPELSSRYFAGKRLGLIYSPLSQSGFIMPRTALREAHISEQLIDISYYKTHEKLRQALANGKVDVIGSYWSPQQTDKYGDLPRIQLTDAEPSKWYVLPAAPDIVCAVADALTHLKQGERGYFSQLEIAPVCLESTRTGA